MTQPRVSVVMAVRDGERWLAEACRSVLTQSLRELELIVVDDGSTDRSPDILAEAARSEARLRLERQSPQGLVSALNRGVALARTPLIARLDADDVARPDRLERQLSFLDAHRDVVLLGSWAEKIDESGAVVGRLRPQTDSVRLKAVLQHSNPFIHSSVVMRAELVRALGGYRPQCRAAEDYDLWLRLSEHGAVANLPHELVQYRLHPGSVTRTSRTRQCFSARLVRRAAAARSSGVPDPLAALAELPDWWMPEAPAQFYGADALLMRFLDMADASSVTATRLAALEPPDAGILAALPHAERVLARRAILRLLALQKRPARLSTMRLVGLLLAAAKPRRGGRAVIDGSGHGMA